MVPQPFQNVCGISDPIFQLMDSSEDSIGGTRGFEANGMPASLGKEARRRQQRSFRAAAMRIVAMSGMRGNRGGKSRCYCGWDGWFKEGSVMEEAE